MNAAIGIDRAKAISLLQSTITGIPHNAANRDDTSFVHWRAETRGIIGSIFGDNSAPVTDFDNIRWYTDKVVWSMGGGTPEQSMATHRMVDREAMVRGFAIAQGHLKSLLSRIEHSTDTTATAKTDRVFIVHGHDGGLKNTVARYIGELGLTPVILHEQPDMGRTVIEKFEKESRSDFAVVLATGDDMAASVKELKKHSGDTDDILKARARQNVIFELGYFVGKIGRGSVFLLTDSGVELPSDIAGVIYSARENWVAKLWMEMDAAGFKFDVDKVRKATAIIP